MDQGRQLIAAANEVGHTPAAGGIEAHLTCLGIDIPSTTIDRVCDEQLRIVEPFCEGLSQPARRRAPEFDHKAGEVAARAACPPQLGAHSDREQEDAAAL